jgi:hypothetical protein
MAAEVWRHEGDEDERDRQQRDVGARRHPAELGRR